LLLEEAARRAGGHGWAESRLFEILGGWVASTDDVDAKLLLDRHSQHHAWRADQWWDRLPVLAEVDRSRLMGPPSASSAAVADELAALQGTVRRLAGAYRVALPRLAGAYLQHRLQANPASDSAVLRTIDIVLADVVSDWRDGEVLLQQLLTDEVAVQEAAGTVSRFEKLLLKAKSE
jgi:hypothetical protein